MISLTLSSHGLLDFSLNLAPPSVSEIVLRNAAYPVFRNLTLLYQNSLPYININNRFGVDWRVPIYHTSHHSLFVFFKSRSSQRTAVYADCFSSCDNMYCYDGFFY